ncbi:MAG TPA: sugar ABC transporter substrate-binding protein [Limnochordia bacterium]|nr:sugar ABC transporter substrate-binding protein [Limnochordia bacterium]
MIKRSAKLGAAAALAAGLAAASAAAAPVTIQFAILDDIAAGATFQQLIDEFQKTHPDIKVQLLQQYADHFDKLAVQAAGGTVPDLFAGYGPTPPQALNQGLLLDLSPFIKRDNLQSLVADFVPSTLAMMTKAGHIYAFPKYSATGAMYYNTEMFADAGLEKPATDWNWSDFAAYAKKLTLTDGAAVKQYGYNLNNDWIWVYPWFVSGGTDFSNPNVVPLDTPAAINTGTYLQDLYKQDALEWRFGRFPEREAAMASSGSWELKAWIQKKLPVDVAPMPTGPAGKAAQTNNDIIGISATTKHPEQAWTFLSWFYSKPVQQEYMKLFALQPARMSLQRSWLDAIATQLRGQGLTVPSGLYTFADATVYAAQEPQFADPAVISKYVMMALNKVIRAHQPVAATFKSEAAAANAYLNPSK